MKFTNQEIETIEDALLESLLADNLQGEERKAIFDLIVKVHMMESE